MHTFVQDFRFGLRLIGKKPGLTAAVVATLALAIGSNTAVFTVVNGILLRPLPFSDADRIVQIWELNRSEGRRPSTISPLNFLDWSKLNKSFARMAVYRYASFNLLGDEGPSRMTGARVSGDFFAVFGVSPEVGRLPAAEDDQPGSRVVLLSHSAWESRFGGTPEIVGKRLTIDDVPYTVIGVMPREFEFPSRYTELWTLPAFDLQGLDRSDHFLFGVGRLKPEVQLSVAQSEADVIAETLARWYPSSNEDSRVLLVPLQEQLVGGLRRELLLLWGAMTLVLLIACANVTSLLVARSVSRQQEATVRFAVGASRARMIRQMLTECLLLTLAGGGAGLILAVAGVRALASQPGFGILRSGRVHLDATVLAFCAAITLATAVGVGLLPALHATKGELYTLLKHDRSRMPRGSLRRHLLKLLVAAQVGITIVLLVAAGLLLKSLFLLQRVDVGFRPQGLVTMQFTLPPLLYPDAVKRSLLFQQVIERIGGVAGVESAGGINDLPFSGSRTRATFDVAGSPPSDSASEVRSADYRMVVGDYFQAMAIAVLKGQRFDAHVRPEGPAVAMVNRAFERKFFADESAIGKVLILQDGSPTVVGVVEDLKHDSLASAAAPEIYVPAIQGRPPEWIYITIRSKLDAEALVPTIRSAAREVIPSYPVYDVQAMTDRLARSMGPQRFNGILASVFAGLALSLSLIGIYSLISFAAREHTGEIAVRMALGARRVEVVRLMVGRGLVPAAAGIVVGLVVALAAAQLVRSLLFGIGPDDPWIFVMVPTMVAVGAVLASYLPARRAAAVDPVRTLRG